MSPCFSSSRTDPVVRRGVLRPDRRGHCRRVARKDQQLHRRDPGGPVQQQSGASSVQRACFFFFFTSLYETDTSRNIIIAIYCNNIICFLFSVFFFSCSPALVEKQNIKKPFSASCVHRSTIPEAGKISFWRLSGWPPASPWCWKACRAEPPRRWPLCSDCRPRKPANSWGEVLKRFSILSG